MEIIERCLPEQGAIEVQHDQPNKEHLWHCHGTHETIIIFEGQLLFIWEDGKQVCGAGHVIDLPKDHFHSSQALENGAKYIIAFGKVDL